MLVSKLNHISYHLFRVPINFPEGNFLHIASQNHAKLCSKQTAQNGTGSDSKTLTQQILHWSSEICALGSV
jgi:hypothetical protein